MGRQRFLSESTQKINEPRSLIPRQEYCTAEQDRVQLQEHAFHAYICTAGPTVLSTIELSRYLISILFYKYVSDNFTWVKLSDSPFRYCTVGDSDIYLLKEVCFLKVFDLCKMLAWIIGLLHSNSWELAAADFQVR